MTSQEFLVLARTGEQSGKDGGMHGAEALKLDGPASRRAAPVAQPVALPPHSPFTTASFTESDRASRSSETRAASFPAAGDGRPALLHRALLAAAAAAAVPCRPCETKKKRNVFT